MSSATRPGRPSTADPLRAGLIAELRALRRGTGELSVQVATLPWLIDCAGLGVLDRAVQALEVQLTEHLADPTSDIGAFSWFVTRGVAGDTSSLEQRLDAYGTQFACDPRTGLRRSDRGIAALAGLLRDQTETDRPVGMLWLFQGGVTATAVIDLWMSHESYREPVVTVNGDAAPPEPFVVHKHADTWEGRYQYRRVFDGLPLDLSVEPYEPCLQLRVTWDMPIWPVWQLTGWVADPRFVIRLQTFRERAAEATVIWQDSDTSLLPRGTPALSDPFSEARAP